MFKHKCFRPLTPVPPQSQVIYVCMCISSHSHKHLIYYSNISGSWQHFNNPGREAVLTCSCVRHIMFFFFFLQHDKHSEITASLSVVKETPGLPLQLLTDLTLFVEAIQQERASRGAASGLSAQPPFTQVRTDTFFFFYLSLCFKTKT